MSANNQETILFFVALVVQAAAIVSIVIARLGQRADSQLRYQRFFFACLALVSAICLLATWTGIGSWMMNGFTVAIMALGATMDVGGTSAKASI